MQTSEEAQDKKKKWWKEANLLVGIGGLVATIVVGVVTYWLTSGSVSREYQERVKAARNDVLSSISKSIGEGVVPSKEKIQSVINSTRRQYAIKEGDFESPDNIIEDILSRVLANEFLDAKRREELSSNLLAVKKEKLEIIGKTQTETTYVIGDKDISSAVAIAIAASTVAAMSLMILADRFKRILASERKESRYAILPRAQLQLLLHQLMIVIVTLATIVLMTWLLYTKVIKAPHIFDFFTQ